jgi:predicted aconitase with swiveling domain
MSETLILHGPAGFGAVVEGELLVSADAFSPRYDLDRASGEISRKGHAIEGHNIAGKILVVPAATGGVAAGWALYDLAQRGIAPQALICSNTNPVFVQGCVLAGISILHRLSPDPLSVLNTGDRVRVDPAHGTLEVLPP